MLAKLLLLAHGALALTTPANNHTVATRACQPPFDKLPYCSTALPLDERVADFIARLWQNTSWIPPQLTARHGGGGSPGPTDAVPELGLPEFGERPAFSRALSLPPLQIPSPRLASFTLRLLPLTLADWGLVRQAPALRVPAPARPAHHAHLRPHAPSAHRTASTACRATAWRRGARCTARKFGGAAQPALCAHPHAHTGSAQPIASTP